jgi:hypothetical protein
MLSKKTAVGTNHELIYKRLKIFKRSRYSRALKYACFTFFAGIFLLMFSHQNYDAFKSI